MLFTNLVSTLATACVVLIPAAMAEDGVKAQAGDVEVIWHERRGCAGGRGPRDQLFKSVCVPVSATNQSMRVLDHMTGMKIRRYNNADCKGNTIGLTPPGQCYDLRGILSIRVVTA